MSEATRPSSHGQRRRSEITQCAADLSTAEGLDGLSIARLASEVGLSKSGVAAHFASKEALQLAAVESAAAEYEARILAPLRSCEPGLPRLRKMMAAWLDHIDAISYRGGCFFAAAGSEFAARPGPVRDRIAVHSQRWIDALEAEARLALRLGELRGDVDANQLVFRLHALMLEANLRRRLFDDERAFEDARSAVAASLREAAA